MDKYNIVILDTAISDIEEIALYIRNELKNQKAAEDLADKIFESIERIAQFPYANSVYVPIRPLKYEYRLAVIVNYLLFYRVNEEAKEVIVARVIYGKRHLERQIKGNET